MVRCENYKTCEIATLCTHGQAAHEAFLPWKPEVTNKLCNENHVCDFSHAVVRCVEVEK